MFPRFSYTTFNVILRRYSLLEVPWRRINNVIAKAMSICVAFGNKVMDTRLPQPVGCGDKYDVLGWYWRCKVSSFCTFFKYPSPDTKASPSPARGEGLHRPWCNKILGTWPSMTGGRGANSFGRSMIEMLGVLAIIAVLSVGGIAGYSKAMEKFKINKAMSEYSLLIFGMLEHLDDLRPIACGNASFCGLASYYQAANLLPGNWTITDDSHISDSNGNMIFTFVRNKRIGFDLYLGAATGSSKFPPKLCKELFANLVKPLHSSLHHAGIWGNINGGNYLYGDHICKTDSLRCLRDISLSEINNLCESCAAGESCCIGIEF